MSTSTQSEGTFASEMTDSSSVESRKSGAEAEQGTKNGDGIAQRAGEEIKSRNDGKRVASAGARIRAVV